MASVVNGEVHPLMCKLNLIKPCSSVARRGSLSVLPSSLSWMTWAGTIGFSYAGSDESLPQLKKKKRVGSNHFRIHVRIHIRVHSHSYFRHRAKARTALFWFIYKRSYQPCMHTHKYQPPAHVEVSLKTDVEMRFLPLPNTQASLLIAGRPTRVMVVGRTVPKGRRTCRNIVCPGPARMNCQDGLEWRTRMLREDSV